MVTDDITPPSTLEGGAVAFIAMPPCLQARTLLRVHPLASASTRFPDPCAHPLRLRSSPALQRQPQPPMSCRRPLPPATPCLPVLPRRLTRTASATGNPHATLARRPKAITRGQRAPLRGRVRGNVRRWVRGGYRAGRRSAQVRWRLDVTPQGLQALRWSVVV